MGRLPKGYDVYVTSTLPYAGTLFALLLTWQETKGGL